MATIKLVYNENLHYSPTVACSQCPLLPSIVHYLLLWISFRCPSCKQTLYSYYLSPGLYLAILVVH